MNTEMHLAYRKLYNDSAPHREEGPPMLLDDLKARLGADQIQTTPEALTRCTLDTWPLRQIGRAHV